MIARALLVLLLLVGSASSVFTGCWWLAPAWAMIFAGFCLFLVAVLLVMGTKGEKK